MFRAKMVDDNSEEARSPDINTPKYSDHEGGGDLKKLPRGTVKLMSSSQVITSVFSVVKELIENSLDAKATSIEIKLDEFGFDKIEVRDNGSGIKRADTPYMAQPHYTSKIRNTNDLDTLDSYGFRGEALGSLCSLANVSITTKTADDPVSTTYVLNHEGKVIETKPSHLGQGTSVTVTNLFQNLPVRRQFYSNKRKQKEEMKRVEDLVTASAIISPNIRFSLKHNEHTVWQKPALPEVRNVLISVLGVKVMSCMEHVKRKCPRLELEVEAFLPKASAPREIVTRSTRDRFFCYVNKRQVIMKDLDKLIKKHYHNITGADSSRYPIGLLHIVLPARCLDVNIDPNKTRVLLHEKDSVFKFVASILDEIYSHKDDISGISDCHDVAVHGATTSHQSETSDFQRDKMPTDNGSILDLPYTESQTLQGDLTGGQSQDLIEQDNCTNCDDGKIPDGLDKNHQTFNLDLSDINLTEELLKQFEGEEQVYFDVSTPEITMSDFEPGDTSTQIQAADNQQGCDRSNSEQLQSPDGRTAMKWALGTAVTNESGNIVKPVEVHKAEPIRTDLTTSKVDATCHQSDTPQSSNKKKTTLCSAGNQTTLFDISVKKPPCGYLYFSKEQRRKVITQNPGATFADIAAIIVEKWKALSNEEKQKYEDLVVRDEQWKKYENALKISKLHPDVSKRNDCHPVTKKSKQDKNDVESSVQKLFMATSSKPEKQVVLDRNETRIKFSLSDLKKVLSEEPSQSQSQIAGKNLMLVGQLSSQSAWVCCHDNCLKLFQPIRAKEEIIYRRLLANHKFITESLDTPELLTKQILKPDLWQTLISLKMSAIKATDPYSYITDSRIVNNGFRIRYRMDVATKQPVVELVAMTTAISGFDVKVLVEILSTINRCYSVMLADCRPVIIKHYLQSEAVRMSRQVPARMSHDEVYDLMRDLQCHLAGGTKSCFHGRPILSDLFHFDELPCSQLTDSH